MHRTLDIKGFLILQILNSYPDILDDKSGPILQYIKTDVGNIPIIQPLYETISEPDTTQLDSDHQEDDIPQVESDSDDCIIQKVIPPPENMALNHRYCYSFLMVPKIDFIPSQL